VVSRDGLFGKRKDPQDGPSQRGGKDNKRERLRKGRLNLLYEERIAFEYAR